MATITSILVIITSLALGFLFYDIHTRGLDAELTISSLLLMILPTTIGILVFILISLYFFSSKLTSRIIMPIKLATQNIESILSGEKVQNEFIYEELNPFIKTIQFQRIEIEQSILKLKEAEKYRRDFTANVSHELKTPLTSINGFAEMLATGMTKEEDVVKFANIIHKEGIRLLELIDSIIDLSKIETQSDDKTFYIFENIDIYEIATNVVANLENHAKEKGITLILTGESSILRGNKRMIEDLLTNIIDNGIKYNKPTGEINIYINKINNLAKIKVIDTGIGISEKDQDRVFERFYRVDKSRSKKISGTGIGLSIVKHIVEYHGGKITLISEIDKGTEIEISLPI